MQGTITQDYASICIQILKWPLKIDQFNLIVQSFNHKAIYVLTLGLVYLHTLIKQQVSLQSSNRMIIFISKLAHNWFQFLMHSTRGKHLAPYICN